MMPPMAFGIRKTVLVALVALAGGPLLVLGAARPAAAAPSWVDRSITVPRLVFAGDVGIGVGHEVVPRPATDITGAGMNLEAAFGVTDSVELGLRTGIRFGDDGGAVGAPGYGRAFFTETYGTGVDTVANPEFHVRWAAYSGRVVEVGLDGRVYTPIERNTDFGIMFGVPLAFHFGSIVRLDTGVYIPVIFSSPATTILSVPAYLWFQVSNKVWLGPMFDFRHVNRPLPPAADNVLLGFGVGYQVASAVDLKWMFLAPRVNATANERHAYGGGFAVQFRIGE
jgi:hypothetical protein